ncbi:uncharacterized protein LOC131151776 [Malania oleifera]|uniref:uncharacterized protein LOC131151776 n=1 Tax=Malania oleifera TaxID=397392 RepID=UPI0025AE88B2|nr:uncharacterized protein LOC131151776 [Malania oleifera]
MEKSSASKRKIADMESKQPSIRVLGQRSIPTSFILGSSNRSKDSRGSVPIEAPNKNLRLSLSDFLERKLHRSPALPKTVQGKQRPFLSPVGCGDVSGSSEGQNKVRKRGRELVDCVIDNLVFEQFKHSRKEREDCRVSCGVNEVGSNSTDDMQESRKRTPFEGGDEKCAARKQLVVLGDDPKPKHKICEDRFAGKTKPKSLYNHYANGGGWWDCNMEGIDSEEVGCSEVWEGMGSITLGGLEWH